MSVNHPIFERNWPSDLWSEDATLSLHTTHSTPPAVQSQLVLAVVRGSRTARPPLLAPDLERALGLTMCGWRRARVLLRVASALIELSRCLEALQPSAARAEVLFCVCTGAAWSRLPLPVSSPASGARWQLRLRWRLNVFFELSCGEGTP